LRAYDPVLGRFLSEDPVPATNLYPYVGNNPTNALDPTGASAMVEDTVVNKETSEKTVWVSNPFHNYQRCIFLVKMTIAMDQLGGLSGLPSGGGPGRRGDVRSFAPLVNRASLRRRGAG
jgi:hypothetical protein